MKKVLLLVLLAAIALPVFADDGVFGFWKIIDDETGEAKSIIGIYEYNGLLYGRLVVTMEDGVPQETIYEPEHRAEELPDQPFYAGLDIIWELEDKGDKWKNGYILDPEKPKVYSSEIWLDEESGNLIVRGKVGPFGRNQEWVPVSGSDLPESFVYPDMTEWVPEIPRTE